MRIRHGRERAEPSKHANALACGRVAQNSIRREECGVIPPRQREVEHAVRGRAGGAGWEKRLAIQVESVSEIRSRLISEESLSRCGGDIEAGHHCHVFVCEVVAVKHERPGVIPEFQEDVDFATRTED